VENTVRNCKFCGGEAKLYTNPGARNYYPGVVGFECSGPCRQHNPGVYYDGDEYKDYDSALIEATDKWNQDNFKPFLNEIAVEAISALQMCKYFMEYIDNMSITALTPEEFLDRVNNEVPVQDLFGSIDNTKELEAINKVLSKAFKGGA
jgi:hypothetical protein